MKWLAEVYFKSVLSNSYSMHKPANDEDSYEETPDWVEEKSALKEEREELSLLKKHVREKEAQRVFAKVFDRTAINTIHLLASRGLFDVLEFVVSTGKEAHVFRAVDASGNFRAVKIYKITTSNFKHMDAYIKGDERFKRIRREKRSIVYAWTRKEYNNLERAVSAGVRVPMPMGFMNNVLVMEFIGDNGIAAKPLKETGAKDYAAVYERIVECVARLMYKARLVHADVSEYNILMQKDEPVLIDIGQAVLLSHPLAKDFFERDAQNISRYFSKMGVSASYGKVLDDIRAWKSRLKQ